MSKTTDTAHHLESALPMNQSHDALQSHLHRALRVAHGMPEEGWSSEGPWVNDVFPGHVVYQHGGATQSRSYTVAQGTAGSDPKVTLGKAKPVHRAYVYTKLDEAAVVTLDVDPRAVDAKEAGDLVVHEGITLLGEVRVTEGGTKTIPVKIIAPGWGSMAYYPAEVLKRDGPKAYPKGTHMMWNHATATEEAERPEGDLDNLAAVLTKDAAWDDNGAKGPGLYSEAKVFSDYATQVGEKGAHIGVSINAAIRGAEGEREGRRGIIADAFVRGYSADFVTKAGAGGAPVVPVNESQRGPTKEHPAMTPEEITKQAAIEAENVTLKAKMAKIEESQNQLLALATVAATLKEAEITFSQKLLERACATPVMKEGRPDPDWIKSVVADFSEGHGGKVTGFGEETTRESASSQKDTDKRLREALIGLGVPEKGLDFAVAGR